MRWPRFLRRRTRIRDKLILLFVFVAALPLGVAGLFITQEARRTLEARVASENAALAGAVGTLVEKKAEQAIRQLQDAAVADGVRGSLEASAILRLGSQLKRVREYSDLFDSVWILDRKGIELANHRDDSALRGESFAHREYYQAVVSSRKPFLSPGYRRTSPPQAVTAAVAVPVTDAGGRLLGVLVAALDLSRLESQIRAATGGGPYRVVLLDRMGRALIHPDPEQLLQFPPPESQGDTRALSSHVSLRDVGWTLTVSQPAAVALAPLDQLERAIVSALLMAVVGAATLALVVAARFTRPIEALRQEVQALAQDQVEEEPGGGSELSSLRREFDRMRASIAEQAKIVEARTRALETLLDIASTVNASLDLDAVLGEALERTLSVTGADLGEIRLYDAARSVLDPICTRGEWRRVGDRPATRRLGEGLSGRVAETRAPVYLSGDAADLETLATTEGVRAAAAIPLVVLDRVQGTLLLCYRRRHQFTDQERQLLAGIGKEIGTALEKVRLYREALEKTERLGGLIRTSAKVAGSLQAGELLRDIAEEAANLLGVEGAGFRLLEGDRLVLGGRYGLAHHVMLTPSIPLGESLSGRVAREGRPIVIPDLREDDSLLPEHKVSALTHGVVAALGVPLRYRDRTIGVLNVFGKERRTFREGEIHLLSAFADHAAIALENARLYTLSQRRLEQAHALFATGQAVNGTLDLASLFDLIIAKMVEHLRVGKCALFQTAVQGGEMVLTFQAGWGLPPSLTGSFQMPVGEGTTGKAILQRGPVWTADILNDPAISLSPPLRARVEAGGYRAELSAPILAKGEPIGALVIYRDEVGPFSNEEVEFLQSMANQAGLAIHNTRLFAALKEHSEQLEERVRARTAELETANQAKSHFLANMSHELRTRMNAIVGFSTLLGDGLPGPLTAKQRRHLEQIQTSGQHLLALINDILDLSRVEAGKLVITLQPVDVGEAVQDTLLLVRGEATARGIHLATAIPAGLPPALADPVRLKQILSNLLDNAMKFTPEAGTVTVGARADEAGLAIWVQDTGVGIAPEDQERIFREFEQADKSLGRKQQGAGLGLALTRKLVELHSGRIHVESAPGQGSTFTFTLPAAEPVAGRAPLGTDASQA